MVEDNTTVRQAVMRGLESLDYQTLAAANGREALDIFERYTEEIALIVSDTVMPEMGGMALLHALREKGYEGQFIVMTGHLVRNSDDHLRSLDIAAQLQKPISLEQLAQVTAAYPPPPGSLPGRCPVCNAALIQAMPEEVADRVPPYVLRKHQSFLRCPGCDRVYWRGSHWRNMREWLKGSGLPGMG